MTDPDDADDDSPERDEPVLDPDDPLPDSPVDRGQPANGDDADDPAPASVDDAPTDSDAAPLSDLAGDISQGDLAATEEDLFEQKQTPEVDREALWRQVADEETAERAIEEMDIDAESDPAVERSVDGESVERVVEKSAYCHACPHFSSPPDVRCTHEGTEILEAVDMEHFRVVDCPIVEENEALEEF